MTTEEAKLRLEVWLKCMECPEDKLCYGSDLVSICEYNDYREEIPLKEAVKMAIKALDQEPKIGHWIKNKHTFWTCDRCMFVNHYNRIKYNYCPNCGAKMEGVENV